MQILGKFELFLQTCPPNPIYYDPQNLCFFPLPTITVGRVGKSSIHTFQSLRVQVAPTLWNTGNKQVEQ